MVEIKFLARFRDIVGKKSVNIEHNGNIGELIDILTEKYGNEFKDALFDKNRELRDYIKILINGKDAGRGLESEVKDGDEIVIFQTIAGG